MTTIATIGLPVANSWQISVGSSWIVLMLIGMALCFVVMLASMLLMGNGRGWSMCGLGWPQETPRRDTRTGTPARSPDAARSTPESEV